MAKLGATSYKLTKFGILPRDEVVKLEVQGTKRGLKQLQTIAVTGQHMSADFIKRIHGDCFKDILMDEAGQFRSIQVTYSSKEAPFFTNIPELILNLCDDVEYALAQLPTDKNERYILNVVQILAQFQHRFVVIHPFVDYNGRMSRLLTNYILMRLKLPIIEIKVENESDRKAYIVALQSADEGNYNEIEDIIAESLAESFQEVFSQ